MKTGGTERKTLFDARVLFDGLIKYGEEIDQDDPFHDSYVTHLKESHEIS